ncbi:hypothetical protein [Calothrix sp. NIES-2098]
MNIIQTEIPHVLLIEPQIFAGYHQALLTDFWYFENLQSFFTKLQTTAR